jgi:hypothetical protein
MLVIRVCIIMLDTIHSLHLITKVQSILQRDLAFHFFRSEDLIYAFLNGLYQLIYLARRDVERRREEDMVANNSVSGPLSEARVDGHAVSEDRIVQSRCEW